MVSCKICSMDVYASELNLPSTQSTSYSLHAHPTFPTSDVLLLSENQSTYIPLGVTHRLRNPGKLPLELIEVQSGSYLGEDDIVRFEDTYGRS